MAVRCLRVGLWPVAAALTAVLPPLDDEGRQGKAWWDDIEVHPRKLLSRLVFRPLRIVRRFIGETAGSLRRRTIRAQRVTSAATMRTLRGLAVRVMRVLRHARYQVATRLRAAGSPPEGHDGRP